MIVDCDDSLIVVAKGKIQDVKRIVELLEN